MNGNIFAVSILAMAILGGCSSAPKDLGKPFVQDKTKSVAFNVGAYAGYPDVLQDKYYSHDLDTLVTSSSNAMLLSADLGGSMGAFGAGALGVGLGFLSGLTDQLPLKSGYVFTAKLNPGEDYRSPTTVLRVFQENYVKLDPNNKENEHVKDVIEKTSISNFICESTTDYSYDVYCADPAAKKYGFYVKTTRPANGQEFPEVMPLPVGQYGVYFINSARSPAFEPKENTEDSYFHLKNNAFVLGKSNTILPLVSPRDDGKRLVFIDGKAKFI
ncbi:hypothetical protein [Aeromonas veronii]|uniref:hypothetical protein n=1 Tax=Aeromonas veronii TaxID=654 RepID=UPI001F278F57|nr:hypothetical protein [Aeromonas veronii]MCF5860044.1 hypothetical protein [Aeromonas veronii]